MVAYTNYPADARIRREAEALVRRGDEVDIVCPRTADLDGQRTFAGVRVHTIGTEYVQGSRPAGYVRRYAAFVVAAGLMVLRLHRRRQYDVIHVHTMPDFLVFSAIGPKLLGARVILDVHDLMPELYASKFGIAETHWFLRLIVAVERLSIRFADTAVAVHRPHLDALIDHGNLAGKFIVLMNLPDAALFAPRPAPPRSDRFTLVYHGMVGSRNGLDVAIRAVALARKDAPDVELLVIGDGDYFPQIRALVEELGVQDNVRLEQGLVPVDQVVPMIREASVGIVPILDDSFTRFMLPVKLLEYVALGIPVIASGTETIRAYFDPTSICLSTPGDPDELAAHIVELHGSVEKREAFSAAARAFTAEYNWEREQTKYFALVDSLTDGRSPHRRRRLRFRYLYRSQVS
jgi:glycosyltransferase involved in cell wall biosynthesis